MKNLPTRLPRHQSGTVLVIAMLFLILLTLVGVAAVNSTSAGMRVVGNMQSRAYALSLAQSAVEQVISTPAVFYTPVATTVSIDGQSITVTSPACLYTRPAKGYEYVSPVTPDDTRWELGSSVTDSITNAKVAIQQGVKIRMAKGGCI